MKIHVPFKSKNASIDIHDNLLFQSQNVYLMDNHRLALWCWFQEISLNKKYNLFHIDAHPDLSNTAIEDFKLNHYDLVGMDLNKFRNTIQEKYNIPLFRWDNYLKIFTDIYAENYIASTSLSFTHHLGSNNKLTTDLSPLFLLKELSHICEQKKFINEEQWIFNLDLDYFFTSQPNKILMFNESYIENIGELINIGLQKNIIKVLTIALSPECCGSWDNSILAFEILNKKMKLPFSPLLKRVF